MLLVVDRFHGAFWHSGTPGTAPQPSNLKMQFHTHFGYSEQSLQWRILTVLDLKAHLDTFLLFL